MDVVEVQQTPAAPAAPLTDGSQIVERDLVTGERTSSEDPPEALAPVFRDDGSPAPVAAPPPERVEARKATIAELRDKAAAMREAAQAEAAKRAQEQQVAAAEQAQARQAAERQAQIEAYLDNRAEAAKQFGCAEYEVPFELSKRLGLDEAAARKFHDWTYQREIDRSVANSVVGRELAAMRQKLEGDAQAAEEQRRQHAWRMAQTAAMPAVAQLPHLSSHVQKLVKETGKAPEDVVAALIVEAVDNLKTTDPRAWRRVAANEYSDREVLAAIDLALAPQPAKPKPAAKTAAPRAAPRVLTEREEERAENKRLAAALVAIGGIKKPDEGTETLDDLDPAGKWQEGLSENEINKRLARAWKRTTTAKK